MSHPGELAERVAAAVTAHPGVAGLHGGEFGAVATYLPGRKLIGVRIGEGDEPVEVGLVVRAGHPIPQVVRSVRRAVGELCPASSIDIVVADIAVEMR